MERRRLFGTEIPKYKMKLETS